MEKGHPDTLLYIDKLCIKNIIDSTVIEIDTVTVNKTKTKNVTESFANNSTNVEQEILDRSIAILRNKLETTSCAFWLYPPNRPQCFPVYIQEYDTTVVFKGCENDDKFFLMVYIRPGRVYDV